MASDKIEKEIAKAISNIKNDRAVTRTLLNDIMEYLSASKERHVEVGTVAHFGAVDPAIPTASTLCGVQLAL